MPDALTALVVGATAVVSLLIGERFGRARENRAEKAEWRARRRASIEKVEGLLVAAGTKSYAVVGAVAPDEAAREGLWSATATVDDTRLTEAVGKYLSGSVDDLNTARWRAGELLKEADESLD